jgi:hypothetical protein
VEYIKSKIPLLFFVSCLLLSSIYIDWWPANWNTASRAALPLSIVLEGNLNIDEYAEFTGDRATVHGHYYSDKGPGIGLIMVPMLIVIDKFYPLKDLSKIDQLQLAVVLGAILFGSLPFSLCALWMYKRRFFNHSIGPLLVGLFFFGSFLFTFSGSFYSHVFTGFLLFAAILSVENRKHFLSGLLIGLCFMTEYTTAVFGVTLGVYFIINKEIRPLLLFSTSAIMLIVIQGIYNYAITGSAMEFTYKYQDNFAQNSSAYGFTYPSIKALYHITLSSYRGLFFYCPMLIILVIFGLRKKIIYPLNKLSAVVILTCILYVILFSMSKSWYGGWTFGPRYLYPVPILLFYFLSEKLTVNQKINSFLIGFGIVGLVHTILAKATILYPPTDIYFPLLDIILPAIREGRWNEWNLFTLVGLKGKASVISFALSFSGLIAILTYFQLKKVGFSKDGRANKPSN